MLVQHDPGNSRMSPAWPASAGSTAEGLASRGA